MSKHIGIVSVNYEGTALCYQTICSEGARLMGESTHPEITIHSFPLANYLGPIRKDDWQAFADMLIESAEKVARCGADFAICPANTAHEAFEFLVDRSPLPWLHIVEVVAAEAVRLGVSRLGILGTRPLMEGRVYRSVLSRHGIETDIPSTENRGAIDRIIFDELVAGRIVEPSRAIFRRVTAELIASGCDGVVMACTEIPLILKSDDADVPLLDSTRLLAKAAVREALA